jgi:hypothetical protein
MGGAARTRLVAVVLLVAVAVPLVIVAVSGDGAEEEEQATVLRVERSLQASEVIVFVDDESANQPERASGRARVTVECLDGAGEVVVSRLEGWPLTDTDGGTLAPHTHLPVDPALLGEVDNCRIDGTDPLLEGPAL